MFTEVGFFTYQVIIILFDHPVQVSNSVMRDLISHFFIRIRNCACFFSLPSPVMMYWVIYRSSGPPLNQTKPPLGPCIGFFSLARASLIFHHGGSKSRAIFFFCCASVLASSTQGVSSSKTAFSSWFFSRLLIRAPRCIADFPLLKYLFDLWHRGSILLASELA